MQPVSTKFELGSAKFALDATNIGLESTKLGHLMVLNFLIKQTSVITARLADDSASAE